MQRREQCVATAQARNERERPASTANTVRARANDTSLPYLPSAARLGVVGASLTGKAATPAAADAPPPEPALEFSRNPSIASSTLKSYFCVLCTAGAGRRKRKPERRWGVEERLGMILLGFFRAESSSESWASYVAALRNPVPDTATFLSRCCRESYTWYDTVGFSKFPHVQDSSGFAFLSAVFYLFRRVLVCMSILLSPLLLFIGVDGLGQDGFRRSRVNLLIMSMAFSTPCIFRKTVLV